MNDVTTKLTLIGVLCLACVGAGWFAHAPAPPTTVTKILQAQAAKAETTYVDDVRTVKQWYPKYVAVRDSLSRPVASDTVHDTLLVPRFIALADSTITSCRTALGSCQRALDANHTVIQVQQAQAPSRTRQFLTAALYLGVGFGVGHSLHH